ncbi:Pantothenate synthetase [subsurface metagenome]
MRLIKEISQMKDYRKKIKAPQVVGFVPTMGAIHQGHLSLFRKARQQCDKVVVSIFVNPIQFGKGDDYQRYPRNLSEDISLSRKEGVDVVFAPPSKEMYPQDYSTFIQVGGALSSTLEGASRSGHFKGVATILVKLFNIVKPDFSYFGEKDYQQVLVVRKVVEELNLDAQIIALPTIRERDGVALSSRNSCLNKEERKAVAILYKALEKAKLWIEEGERNPFSIVSKIKDLIKKEPLAKLDYVAVVNPETLEKVEDIKGEVLIFLAVSIGSTRLIDNMRIGYK